MIYWVTSGVLLNKKSASVGSFIRGKSVKEVFNLIILEYIF